MITPKRTVAASIARFLSSGLLLVVVGVVLVAVSIYVWQREDARNLAQVAVDVESKARSYSSETETRFDRIHTALTRLASSGSPRNEAGIAEWKKDAAFYIDTFLGIDSIAWVDDTFRLREIVPLQDNAAYIGKLVSSIELSPSDVSVFLPTYDAVDFRGFIHAIVGLKELIQPVVDELRGDYMLQVSDGTNPVYISENWKEPNEGFIANRSITLKNARTFNLTLAPTPELLAAGAGEAQNTLWFALLMSFATIIAIALAQNYLGKARSSELRYESLFESSQDAIFVTDLKGEFRDANLAATQLVGYSLAELQQMTMSSLLAQNETHPVDELPQAWLDGAHTETGFRHKLGQAIPIELGISQVGDTKKSKFIVAIARDISERKVAEAELRQYQDQLEAIVAERTRALQDANAELESFSFSVSHDLRAPLRHINGFVHLLDKGLGEELDPVLRRYLKNVIGASQRMGQLIDDLLQFSRTSRTEMVLSPVDPSEVIKQVRDDLQPAVADRQISWQIGCLPKVLADASLLRVVWTNLIANAVKFTGTRECAIIEIGVDRAPRADDRVVFFIRDNGVGFDPAYAQNLFGVFQRLHRDDEFEGTGIGLATVRRIVHRHGGEIWAEAVEGQGAGFFFTLKPA